MAYMLDMALAKLTEILKKAKSKYVIEEALSESRYIKIYSGDGEHCKCVIRLSYHNTSKQYDFHLGNHKDAHASFKDWHQALRVMRDKAPSIEEKEVFSYEYALEHVKRHQNTANFEEIRANIRKKHQEKLNYNKAKKKKQKTQPSILPEKPFIPIRVCDVAHAVRWLLETRKCLTKSFQTKLAAGFYVDYSTRLGRVHIAIVIGDQAELPINFCKDAEKITVGDENQNYHFNDWEKLVNDINDRLEKIEAKPQKRFINFRKSFREQMLMRKHY